MAGEEEATADPARPVRPVLLTYQKRKSRVFTPPPESHSPQIAGKNPSKTDQISLCNSCDLSYSTSNPDLKSESIFIFKSQWRILLLCKNCLSSIRSGDSCSYCLQSKPDDVAIADVEAQEFLQCVKCSCRVHRCCLPREHRQDCATWHKSGKAGEKESSFTCIDCTPIPNFCQNLITKEIDADVAIRVLSEEKDDDIDVAIKIHLAINGSQRVSKKVLNSSSKLKKCESDGKRGRPVGSIRGNHRGISENLSGIKYGHGSVVLALECVKRIEAPLIIKFRGFNNKGLEKTDQNGDLKTGTENSELGMVSGQNRYEIKYKRKRDLVEGDLVGTDRNNCVNCDESQERKTDLVGTDSKNCVNYDESQGRETGTGTEENRDEKDRYERKYKRRKCVDICGGKEKEPTWLDLVHGEPVLDLVHGEPDMDLVHGDGDDGGDGDVLVQGHYGNLALQLAELALICGACGDGDGASHDGVAAFRMVLVRGGPGLRLVLVRGDTDLVLVRGGTGLRLVLVHGDMDLVLDLVRGGMGSWMVLVHGGMGSWLVLVRGGPGLRMVLVRGGPDSAGRE